jgi:hypothetical protein
MYEERRPLRDELTVAQLSAEFTNRVVTQFELSCILHTGIRFQNESRPRIA